MLKKCAMFSDIHFGRKDNSVVHNKDCVDFIEWFITQVKKDKEIDHIIFLGDWFEIRTSIDQETINFSQKALDNLNSLGMPIYLIVGNHDLYRKFSREIHSINIFKEYDNVIVIDAPLVRPELHNSLLTPFIFPHEFDSLIDIGKDSDVWFGHFELNGFFITGYHNVKMEHGENPDSFKNVGQVFSGHYHRRQQYNNIMYIGSPFGFDFSDIEDFDKGMTTYEYSNKDISFVRYDAGAKFVEIKLTELLTRIKQKKISYPENISIRCILNMVLDYETHMAVKDLIYKTFKVRDLKFDDPVELRQSIKNTDVEEYELLMENIDENETVEINEMVLLMLGNINNEKIDNKLLEQLYKEVL